MCDIRNLSSHISKIIELLRMANYMQSKPS